jgi:polyphosphate kinase
MTVSSLALATGTPYHDVVFSDPKLFLNRELSWLAFNDRVLEESKSADLPLFERLKFIGIVASNLDEFFMVRVAGLKQQLAGGVAETGADGMLPAEQLALISDRTHAMVAEQYRVWNEELLPALGQAGIYFLARDAWNAEQKAAARAYFNTAVFPALTPLAVDPGHPFPHLRNKSMNLAVILGRDRRRRRRVPLADTTLAVVQVPGVLSRLVPLPCAQGVAFTGLGELISAHMGDLFPGFLVKQIAPFRVTRNTDLNVDEEESEDLLSTIQAELRRRERGAAVRLEIQEVASTDLIGELTDALKLGESDVYRIGGPLQLQDFMGLTEADARPELRVEPWSPVVPQVLRDADTVVQVVGNHDVLLHHPYEAFDPVVRFVSEAADDPNVLAIKQTLYRTSGDSPIVRALSRAAENGKQVAVLVEIKARFDEANNIAWARRLEENGVHVVYGLLGLKTHCKLALVVRREGAGIRRYVHLGTGNYNPTTARLYTDLSLFTARPEIAEDVSALFNMLTGYCEPPVWKRLAVAPLGLHERVLQLIERERDRAAAGEPARIVAKLNALVDPTVIKALYAAASAGVEIDLIVRGICCLRPGVPGVSERIRVISVVDRFLEHSRVFAFGAFERTEVYMSSADWMPRNFLRRIECFIPIEDPAIKQRLLDEVLGIGLRDNVKARRLSSDGTYGQVEGSNGSNGVPAVRSQSVLMEAARRYAGLVEPAETNVLRRATTIVPIPAPPV